MTAEGLKKLKAELEQLVKVERPAISKQIGEAIEKGDISENAEYDAAKDAQGMLEARIAMLQSQIASARIIDESKIDTVGFYDLHKYAKLHKKNIPKIETILKKGKITRTHFLGWGIKSKEKINRLPFLHQ